MAKAKQAEPEADSEETQAPAGGKRSVLRLALFAALALLLSGGAAAGAYYFFFAGEGGEQQAAPAPKPPTFLDLPEVLVNLSSAGNERTQYLKVKVVLELSDAALVQQIQPVLPRVMDTFQVFLRELRPADLEGSAGVYRLKEELTRRVNTAIAPSRVSAVLFKEMVVQ
ncbi:MAG TPA: flagellar basal body-associated FliL family protein [Xanthobacteraceae bacterium]|nr:flagellar basal body-associated FliL family protein [Xanthobacteraceae bacterium]